MDKERATKKQKVEKKTETDAESKLQSQLEDLEKIQQKIDGVQEELHEAVFKLQHEFANKRKPFEKQRDEVIKRIPGFWKQTVWLLLLFLLLLLLFFFFFLLLRFLYFLQPLNHHNTVLEQSSMRHIWRKRYPSVGAC